MVSALDTCMEQNITKVESFTREMLVSFKDPRTLWSENWFALAFEVSCAVILLQLFRHAKKSAPYVAYLSLAAGFSTYVFEILPLTNRPGYQLWWHHQGLANVLNQRVPSYVITLFALIHYMAYCLTNKSNLPAFTRSVVTAITAMLITFPFLWLAPRLLMFLHHFDDPVFKNQLFGIPYVQILVLFLLHFHSSHLFHQNFQSIKPQDRNTFSYIKCSLISGLVSAVYTLIEQYLLYILLNLTMHLNTGVCVIAAVLILTYIARHELEEMQIASYSMQDIFSPLLRKEWLFIAATLLFTTSLPLWLNTQDLKSSDIRLELGPCGISHEISNTSPLEIVRRQYVCPDDATHLKFDFHCVPKKELMEGVKSKARHYTICGKPFKNPLRTFQILFAYSASCLALFYAMALISFTFKVQENKVEDVATKKID